MTYHFAIGKSDINGEDWGDIFSKAIDGQHLGKPVGLADVVHEGMAWSVKSVKMTKPHERKKARVISGRCSPDYSYGISNPHEDIQQTGTAVLSIYNERINIAKDLYEPLRTVILVRDFNALEFSLFEHDTVRFVTSEYVWKANKNSNLEGYHVETGRHCFTWQPHGSQFTVLYDIPAYACKFKIKRPAVFDADETLRQIGFDESWVVVMST
ncbi:MAG: hypothetical protein FWD06_03180 [Oscillospiraceae bacterium]|nr:hypothetical protein [Oscillospiraceae bacterium]